MTMKKILIIAPAWVGDTVMAQCLFKLLTSQRPDVVIDVVAPEWTAALLTRMKEVRHVIPMPLGHGQFGLWTRYKIGRSLRKQQYDQAIVLPNSWKSALVPFFARIKKRTGWLGESRYFLLNDHRVLDENKYPLMIERFMALGLSADAALSKPYPEPSFDVTSENQQAVLKKHDIHWSQKPVLAICAGAAFGPSKQWPVEHFVTVAKRQIMQGYDIWLFGSEKDKTVTDEISEGINHRCVNLAGKLKLNDTVDLLSLASGIISNDSGLLHISAAFHKPLLALYGSTSPDFTPPLSKSAIILKLNLPCQPCFERHCPLLHHRCMRDLTPDLIFDAMTRWAD